MLLVDGEKSRSFQSASLDSKKHAIDSELCP